MRPEFDGEIDSVLRGHARRGGARPATWAGGLLPSPSNESAPGAHLDADEIAAFGEGALPAAARSRYSAHLADCDDCRRTVAQVALAAGAADRIEERERIGVIAAAPAAQSPSWRERLAAFFAPRAWRYAMPVVALVAVSAVVLVVTRRLPREGAADSAQTRSNTAQRAPGPAAPEAHHADAPPQQQPAQPGTLSGEAGTAAVTTATGEDAKSPAAVDQVAKLRPKAAEVEGRSAAGGTAGAQPELARQAQAEPAPPPAQSSYAEVAAATPSPVPPPPAAATAPRDLALRDGVPQPTPAPVQENVEVARERDRDGQRGEAAATKRHGPQRGISSSAAGLSTGNASKDERAQGRARGPQNNAQNRALGANRADSDEGKAKREEAREQQAETRAVGGRSFRREGGVWIDTAYRAGQATVVVRAGSEQYRALVADEPEIGRISRALGGEAVIVWKGRAYRIKP